MEVGVGGFVLSVVGAVLAYVKEQERAKACAVPVSHGTADPPALDHLPWWTSLALPPFVALGAVALYVRSRWDEIAATATSNSASGIMALLCLMALATFYGSGRPMRAGVLKVFLAVYLVEYEGV